MNRLKTLREEVRKQCSKCEIKADSKKIICSECIFISNLCKK